MNSGAASSPFQRQVIKARHDLRNPLAHILGFSEMLAEHAAKLNLEDLRADSLAMNTIGEQILSAVNQALDPVRVENGQSDLPRLHEQLRALSAQILHLTDGATQKFGRLDDDVIINDLARIAGAAQKLAELAELALPSLSSDSRGG
jgi:signal transduction histidine kinase